MTWPHHWPFWGPSPFFLTSLAHGGRQLPFSTLFSGAALGSAVCGLRPILPLFCPCPLPSLGLTILEVACNMELPHGGEGWQQLRQGYLPAEFTAGELGARVGRDMVPWGGHTHVGGNSWQWGASGLRDESSLT